MYNVTNAKHNIGILSAHEILEIHHANTSRKVPKSHLARMYDVSSDTITRAIENAEAYLEWEQAQPNQSKRQEPKTEQDDTLKKFNAGVYWTATEESIMIHTRDGKSHKTYSCGSDFKNFKLVQDALYDNNIKLAIELLSPKQQLINYSQGEIGFIDSVPYFRGHKLENSKLIQIILEKIIDGDSNVYTKLINFLHRVLKNPSQSAVTRLYDFVVHNDIEIMEDGRIVALKAIRNDYYDIYSGKILNKPGTIVSVPREEVDSDDDRTCSYGLHVGSIKYVAGYGNSTSSYIYCAVDPAHVVSIPTDYNNTKCRVSEYYILGEISREAVVAKLSKN